MAASIIVLLVSAFGPVLGWNFNWVPLHWITGVILGVAVVFHIVRALFVGGFRFITPDGGDVVNGWRMFLLTAGRRSVKPGKPGKYIAFQKLYHWGIAVWIIAILVTGGLMMIKIDTPLWKADPYVFSDFTWGMIFTIHGFLALGMITLVIMHVYFALRPDKIFLFRSMIVGWITRREYQAEFDPDRWPADGARPTSAGR